MKTLTNKSSHTIAILSGAIALTLSLNVAAGEVSLQNGIVKFDDGFSNNSNDVTVGLGKVNNSTGFIVEDAITEIRAGAGCTALTANQALCGANNPSKVLIFLGGGNDSAGLRAGNVPQVKLDIEGGSGNDNLVGSDLADRLQGGDGNDHISGQDGDDTIDGGSIGNPLLPDLFGNDVLNGGEDNDNINGGNGNDILNGDEGRDNLVGGGGKDNIKGGSGKDTLDGGDGDDKLDGGSSTDKYFGGGGSDRIKAKDGNRESINCGFLDFATDQVSIDPNFGDALVDCGGDIIQ